MRKDSRSRHGCVTVFLVLTILTNGFLAVYVMINSIIATKILHSPVAKGLSMILLLLFLANLSSAILLLRGKKIGFYLFCFCGLVTLALFPKIGLHLVAGLPFILGILILYGILQLKNHDGRSSWDSLN